MKKRTKAFFLRVIAMSVSVVIATCLMSETVSGSSSVSQLESKYDSMESKLDDIKKKISRLKDDKNNKEEYKNQLQNEISVLEEQISNMQTQIDTVNSQIDALNKKIKKNETLLAKKQKASKTLTNQFLARLRTMYMSDSASTLSVMLCADNFADMLEKADYANRIADNDRRLLTKYKESISAIKEKIKEIKADEAELEVKKKSVQDKKSVLDRKKSDLNSQKAEISSIISGIESSQNELNSEKAKIEAEMEKLSDEIADLIRQNESKDDYEDYVGGEFLWPVKGFRTLSSTYGWRTLYGARNFHTGIDITGRNSSGENVNGQPVIAANSGTVIKAVTSYTPGRGYGKHVIIDHGGGKSTLYGHMSSVLVSVGQKVTKGQTIGHVGSTGNSTGPHLHFEIRINGDHTNPLNYFS